MNPLTNIRNQNKLNESELKLGIAGDLRKSWHQRYKDSAWIYIGGLPYDLTEGDIITVFSQFGEVININLLRHADTGKSRGFCFLCYQDQRSTVLAVDNFNGITLLKRVIRVDHVEQYKVPKYKENADEETKRLWEEGCAPKPIRRTGIELRALKVKLKADRKREKKEKKKAKKEKKKLKKLMKSTKNDVNTDWKGQTKLLDKSVKEENFYGPNKHFNFGKKAEAVEEPTHNVRPDFEKADWRDIEIWKEIREREKAEQGQKKSDWKPEEHYVSSRYR
uniref:RRM domain-containing protein n=1 Tax=Angiostrongylus cantonensis TaxID=6313 RepID=A0A0K0DKM9_ANGCA